MVPVADLRQDMQQSLTGEDGRLSTVRHSVLSVQALLHNHNWLGNFSLFKLNMPAVTAAC